MIDPSIAAWASGLTIAILSFLRLVFLNKSFRASSPSSLSSLSYNTREKLENYQDKDGTATTESFKAFSDKWWWRSIVALSSIGAICACISTVVTINPVLSNDRLPLQLIQSATWCFSIIHAIISSRAPLPRRHGLAHDALWTSLGLAILTGAGFQEFHSYGDKITASPDGPALAAAVLRAICCLAIRRRPDVYHDGQLVDREHTVSLLSKLTFAFVTPTITSVGRLQGSLEHKDLPQLPARARAEVLRANLDAEKVKGKSLFQALYMVHRYGLLRQLLLALAYALFGFAPRLALFAILRSLETDQWGDRNIWAAALGVGMFLTSASSAWLWWVTYSHLAVPIYSELVALIYAKGMRRKDIHRAGEDIDGDDSGQAEQQQQQEQHETLNLVTLDAKRISDCASYNHLIPSSILQFIVACGLLTWLIGWQALLAGIVANFAVSPVNFYVAKVYGKFQVGLMASRDHRTTVVREMVENLRQIKFSSLESHWQEKVTRIREHEVRQNFKSIVYETGFQATWILGPLLISSVALTVYAVIHGRLEASTAFTAMSIFGSLEVALAALPHLLTAAMEAKVSIDRIDKFLAEPEKVTSKAETDRIQFDDAYIAWPTQEGSAASSFKLSGLTVTFPSKGLSVIAGRTGTGKSLLLSAILGECETLSGSIYTASSSEDMWRATFKPWIVPGTIAYVPQNPWIENGTIRSNILMRLPLDQARYDEAVFAAGLERDLQILADGDRTEIGANGVNLSGGQRARVSFARALYSRAEILIMDDIFSALDADTSKHVLDHGIHGRLADDRTRILASHHTGLCLPKADYCVVLGHGTALYSGPLAELKQREGFSKHISSHDLDDVAEDNGKPRSSSSDQDAVEGAQQTAQIFIAEETRAIGARRLKSYLQLFKVGDKLQWSWAAGFLAALLYTVALLGRGWVLALWTGSGYAAATHHRDAYYSLMSFAVTLREDIATTEVPLDFFKWMGLYVGVSMAASLMGTLRFFLVRWASLRFSQAMFQNMLAAILGAPLRWVDTVPLGRVLNRLTTDMFTMDIALGTNLAELLVWALQILAVVVASVMVSPYVLIPAALLLSISLRFAFLYLKAAREAKRLESVTRSPILEHFTSSITGLTTIRAFGLTSTYLQAMFTKMDHFSKISWSVWLFKWWIQLRIGFLGAIFAAAIAFLIIRLGVSASLCGFAISFVLQYSQAVSDAIGSYSTFEMDMTALERVAEYANVGSEPQEGLEPPAFWPTQGRIEVENLTVRYAPELPAALEDLTFSIENNERIGIVGRTGSGKSTLALALFRFIEASSGTFRVDGLDACAMKLTALRRAMALVPQHPTLFAGTIKLNLDPRGIHSDLELGDALRRVHLTSDRATGLQSFALNSPVAEGGRNFSQGQRQLICLARAILQRPKIMILDEASSSVDAETDSLMQETIRVEFGRNMSTLLVIAHRLSSVADFDKILVLDHGKLVEFDSPRNLLAREGGVFHELVQRSGDREALQKSILGATP